MSTFIFSHININSFRHKYAFMHDLLLNNVVNHLAISETKIDSTFPNAQFHTEGFSILRQDNTSSSCGLLIYIRSDIPHRCLPDAEVNENGIEYICVELTIAEGKTVISCVYKHPKVPNDVFMNDALQKHSQHTSVLKIKILTHQSCQSLIFSCLKFRMLNQNWKI